MHQRIEPVRGLTAGLRVPRALLVLELVEPADMMDPALLVDRRDRLGP